MAKQSAIQKNINRKTLIDRLSEKRAKLKKALMNKELPFEERVKIQMKLESMPRNSSRIRYRNRCFLSGRPRGCLLYTSPSPRDLSTSRMPSSA